MWMGECKFVEVMHMSNTEIEWAYVDDIGGWHVCEKMKGYE